MKGKRILFPIKSKRAELENIQLLRVEVNSNYTKLDFGLSNKEFYKNGTEVLINKHMFVFDHKNHKKFALIKNGKIPFLNNQLSYKTSSDWLFFSLYFEPISFTTDLIDVMEDPDEINCFNFYKIPLESGVLAL